MSLLLLFAFLPGVLALPSWQNDVAWRDSLTEVPPRFRADWLRARGLDDPFVFGTINPESTGLRLVGKYGRGPSREVTGQDSLLFLSNGSEVAVFSTVDPGNPALLSEIQARSIVVQSAVRDSILYIGDYAEVSIWDISDPVHPAQLSAIPYGVGDFAVSDSLLAFTRQGTFRVYSVADSENPLELGTLPDSGTVRAASGSKFVLSSNQDIVYIIDCSDPTHPQRCGSFPGYALGLDVRDNLCCVAMYWTTDIDHFRFDVLDISDPGDVRRIGQLADVGGYDIHLEGSLAFVSGYQSSGFEFTIISIADSTNPAQVGRCATPGDNDGVWRDLATDRAYVADRFRGMTVMDVSNPNSPVVDTSLFSAGSAEDVWVDGNLMYVASNGSGMHIVDVTDPTRLTGLASVDSSSRFTGCQTIVAKDSFAYMHLSPSLHDVRVVDVTDPTHPIPVAGANAHNWPEDMVLRDSLMYVAEDNFLEVINVARPREPELVGSCELNGYAGDLDVVDTLAFLSHNPLLVINVADPENPAIVGTWSGRTHGLDAEDSIVYGTGPYTGLVALSVADPTSPYVLDSLYMENWWNDVAVSGSLAMSVARGFARWTSQTRGICGYVALGLHRI